MTEHRFFFYADRSVRWVTRPEPGEYVAITVDELERLRASSPNAPYRPFGKLNPDDPFDQAFVTAWNRAAALTSTERGREGE